MRNNADHVNASKRRDNAMRNNADRVNANKRKDNAMRNNADHVNDSKRSDAEQCKIRGPSLTREDLSSNILPLVKDQD
jgi:hypothetical protein